MASNPTKRGLSDSSSNIPSAKKPKQDSKPEIKDAKHVTKPSDYGALTIPVLKGELQDRGLHGGGTKPKLVARLQSSDLQSKRDDLNASNTALVAAKDYGALKLEGLKAELTSRYLKVGGTKTELVERLHQHDRDQVRVAELKGIFEEEVERDENEAVEYEKMMVPAIKSILRERGLPLSGSSHELRQRLKNSDLESTVEYKQAMEADAIKRRERFQEAREKRALTESEDEAFRRHHKKYDLVIKRGPGAKPLYDDWGYALSYKLLASRPKTRSKSDAAFRKRQAYMEMAINRTKEKASLMGVPSENTSGMDMDWIVARDLKIPAHTVEVNDFKEWKKRGFTASRDDVDMHKISNEERRRILRMCEGSAFRVGYND